MARLAISIIVCLAAVSGTYGAGNWWTNYGMDLSVKAYDAVCWYEYYKLIPTSNPVKKDVQCQNQAQYQKEQMGDDDEKAKEYFGPWVKQMAMPGLPDDYVNACGKYLDDANLKEPSDESDALNDPNSSSAFVFKGFAYCMINTLRKRQGEKAIEAVKNERTHMLKNWRMAMLDRDNEFRDRHGVDKFRMLNELNDAAQNWADTMAKECNMYHSKGEDSIRRYSGKDTGESIATGSSKNDATYIPYSTTNMWYSEIRDYPYPDSCDTKNPCGKGGRSVGHFTQSVWSDSKYVGYGYAYSEKCKKWFTAGRYYPAGNAEGGYAANVLPPKN